MRIKYEKAYSELLRILYKIGFEDERARLCAKLFTESSLDGIYSHGLNRFSLFIKSIKDGYTDIHAYPEKIEEIGLIERWDGKLGPGNLNAYYCMNQAIKNAKKNGIGCIALKNTNHWMRGGTYGWQAANSKCISLCLTNTLPNMPPWGGEECKLGNNPLVIAVPRENGQHIVLDMAMTQFSYGKINEYKLNNKSLPVEGGFDQNGKLTKDPNKIIKTGRPLPMGYWKGSGLSIMIDLIVTLLSCGQSTSTIGTLEAEYGVSQIFLCFDISKDSSTYCKKAVNEIINFVHEATPVNRDGKVYYPGERTLLRRKYNLQKGIPVNKTVWKEICNM